MPRKTYKEEGMRHEYPVWVAVDGTEWTAESTWEQCEFHEGPLQSGACCNTVEYVGVRGDARIQLCGVHFAKIEPHCCMRWDEI